MRIRLGLGALVLVASVFVVGRPAHAAPPSGVAGTEQIVPPSRGAPVQVGPALPPPLVPAEEMLPADSGTGRRIVYSNQRQRIWAVDETGVLLKTHQVSGRIGTPSTGTYRVWSRSETTCAVSNQAVCWRWMVRFAIGPNGGNVGFHEIPVKHGRPVQTDSQLGQALSGGCVRQATDDAISIWDWAQIDTVVVVV